MEKTYKIRYNTQSTDDSTNWRLICDEEEILVEDIYITSQTNTTKDWVEELKQHKYHIICTGHLIIKDNVAYIINNTYDISVTKIREQLKIKQNE